MVIVASGTIKQAQLAAIRHNREIVARYRARAKLPGTLTAHAFPIESLFHISFRIVGYQDSFEEYLQTSAQEIEALQD